MSDSIGENLTFYRKTRKLTQKQLSERTGLSIAFISQIENNISKPSEENLKKLADSLDLSPSDLLVDESLKKQKNEYIDLIKLLIDLTKYKKLEWTEDEEYLIDKNYYRSNTINGYFYVLVYDVDLNYQINTIWLEINKENGDPVENIEGRSPVFYNALVELVDTVQLQNKTNKTIYDIVKGLEKIKQTVDDLDRAELE